MHRDMDQVRSQGGREHKHRPYVRCHVGSIRVLDTSLKRSYSPATCHSNPGVDGVASTLRRLQARGDAIKREQAKHMPNRNARLSGLDTGNCLNVNA